MERAQKKLILKDLARKMVFLVGPRQVGKTWLANDIAAGFERTTSLNWDNTNDRKIIRRQGWLRSTELLVLDELHKMPRWKGFIKGVFDKRPDGMRILVTGSARLNLLRQAGPSLAGRFFAHRLMPFSPAEVGGTAFAADLDRFIVRGGFPEPFLADEQVDADRWRSQYLDGLVSEDVLDLERIQDLGAMRTLLSLLRERVGSPVSYQSLSEDTGVSPNTVRKYIAILEALFVVFRVTPLARDVARSLLKSPKLYFFDTGLVRGDAGARFENFVAACLLKHAMFKGDTTGRDVALRYIRTKEGKEVDFCLVTDDAAELLVEAKAGETDPSRPLLSFSRSLGVPGVQIVKELDQEERFQSVAVRSARAFLRELSI